MVDPVVRTISAYRKNETLPIRLDKLELIRTLNGLNAAVELGAVSGVPTTAKGFGDKVLLEGREDAGANEFNYNNKKATTLYNIISDQYPDSWANPTYAAAVLDKTAVADRLKIPFELAWNGTGKTKQADGQRHTARSVEMAGAIDDPRNKDLLELINRALMGNLTDAERAMTVPYNIIRANIAGTNKLYGENGTYSKEALAGANKAVEGVITDKKLSPQRAAAVRKDLEDVQLLDVIPVMWKQAAGIPDGLLPSGLDKATPDTIDILNTLIGNK